MVESLYLLDTNVCIQALKNSSRLVVERLKGKDPLQLRLCSVVKAELYYGARRSARPAENLRTLEEFSAPLLSLPFDDACAVHYGVVRQELQRLGKPIGPNDLMIAAVALAHQLTLVTHNTDEFSRVVGLRLEDWEA